LHLADASGCDFRPSLPQFPDRLPPKEIEYFQTTIQDAVDLCEFYPTIRKADMIESVSASKLPMTASRMESLESVNPTEEFSRFMIWVDGVGGYMVCADEVNSIGQATQKNDVAIPISGDIHQVHAKIQTADSGHLLLPVGPVSIDQTAVLEPQLLTDNRTFEMGESVSLRYCKPHPWSTTAVISFESRNRTWPWSDAVLIAGNTIILGPNAQSHIRCTRWEHEVILLRRDGKWQCRSFADFTIDGQSIEMEGALSGTSRVEGRDFSFSLESLQPL
jgi:hypothetical protein